MTYTHLLALPVAAARIVPATVAAARDGGVGVLIDIEVGQRVHLDPRGDAVQVRAQKLLRLRVGRVRDAVSGCVRGGGGERDAGHEGGEEEGERGLHGDGVGGLRNVEVKTGVPAFLLCSELMWSWAKRRRAFIPNARPSPCTRIS